MASISFAKVAGAGSSAPVSTPTTVVEPEVVQTPQPQNLPAVQQSAAPARRFYAGDEDDAPPPEAADIRLPHLNIIQGLSDPELKKVGPDGTLVLGGSLAIPQPARIVVAGFGPKRFAEKPLKYVKGQKSRLFDTLEQVYAAGGTDQWKFSRSCQRDDGSPASNKPWFMPMKTALVLIQKPEKLAKPEDEAYFYAVSEDGVAFAPCLYTVKSTSFSAFFVELNSVLPSLLSGAFSNRYVQLTTRQVTAFEPVVKVQEPTSEAVRKLAKSILA